MVDTPPPPALQFSRMTYLYKSTSLQLRRGRCGKEEDGDKRENQGVGNGDGLHLRRSLLQLRPSGFDHQKNNKPRKFSK